MKKWSIVMVLALGALAGLPALHTAAQGKIVRLTLIDQNGSGEDGAAQLTDQGDGTTKVELIMTNAPEGALQPAKFHTGTCATLGAALTDLVLGDVTNLKSTTVVKMALADLTASKHAIAVYKAAGDNTVISCGNLPQTTTTSGPLTLEQALAALLDKASELQGTVAQQETDAAQNAYTLYKAVFATNEEAIKAKDAATWQKLETLMKEVNTAITAGDWAQAKTAADELETALDGALKTLGSNTLPTSGNSTLPLLALAGLGLALALLAGGAALRRRAVAR
jgi:hypothetical protein